MVKPVNKALIDKAEAHLRDYLARKNAGVAESVDAEDLKSSAEKRPGSSPGSGTSEEDNLTPYQEADRRWAQEKKQRRKANNEYRSEGNALHRPLPEPFEPVYSAGERVWLIEPDVGAVVLDTTMWGYDLETDDGRIHIHVTNAQVKEVK